MVDITITMPSCNFIALSDFLFLLLFLFLFFNYILVKKIPILYNRLVEYKVDENLAKILDRNKDFCLWIDTELIEPFPATLGATIQLVGEIEWRETLEPLVPLLKARTVRCVDTLDLITYEKALAVQRNYLQEG